MGRAPGLGLGGRLLVVELRSGGRVSARVGRRFLQEGRVGSRRDPSDGQVSYVVDFTIPLLRRGALAFIAIITRYLYPNPLSSLLLTIPLHLTMSSVVLAELNSSTNPGDLAEKVNSGTNPGNLVEKVNSGTNSGDLAERVNSGTNPGDLAEKVNSITNLGDLAKKVNSSTNPGDLAEKFGRARHVHHGGCSGGRSLISTSSTHRRVSKMVEDLPKPGSAQLMALPRHVSGRVSRGWDYLDSELVYDRMDLGDLRGMPKMSNGKAPSTHAAAPAREVGVSPAREAPKASSKRPIDASTEQADDLARRHKKVKVLTRRHKSRHGEGESRSHSKGKEPAVPSEEPDTPVESDEGDASPVHHRPRSMKDLFKTKVHKGDAGYYTLQIQHFQTALFDQVHDAGWLITFIDYRISQLQQELDALKSGGGPEAVAKAEERASELEQELEKTKRERDEALQRLEASEKELNEVRSNLAEI
ncbi:hypothetical protein B296_00012486 [Ensete ventricosum]|uniref:Uncharacterized protein n=1 Tax=Ensete ventricosum TaxID=4639 RepID=A0A427AD32_ENSVE|nr:hypothetical protein B296_00012486 [Ensete ventricosum]